MKNATIGRVVGNLPGAISNCSALRAPYKLQPTVKNPLHAPGHISLPPSSTTQKEVANNKIFELRAETRTERSLGCQMTIAEKDRLLGQTDGAAGPKTRKKCHF